MTAAELIEKLKVFPPETRIVVDAYEQNFDDPVILYNYMLPDVNKRSYYDWQHKESNEDAQGSVRCIVLGREAKYK